MNIIKKFLPITILALAIFIAFIFISTKPTPERKAPPKIQAQVEAIRVEVGETAIILDNIGTIIPSQEVDIKSKVAGTIETLSPSFQPGAFVKKGDVLLELDKTDYVVALSKAEASYESAKADYEIELGQQNVAKNEYEKLADIIPGISKNSNINADLALRQPQLAKAKANVDIAKASLDSAKLDLEHTVIKAPFDALITSRSVSVGQHISTSEVLANLVDIDEYWVDVSIAVETLYNNKILSHDATGLPVTIVTKANEKWQGELLQTVNVLQSGTRMGKLLVKIEDPLALEENQGKVPLLMGDQVNILLQAGIFENTLALPRSAVKNNDTVWLIFDETLQSQKVNTVWKDNNYSYIDASNLPKQSVIMTSDLANPVDGLEVSPYFPEEIENQANQASLPSNKPENIPPNARQKGRQPQDNQE